MRGGSSALLRAARLWEKQPHAQRFLSTSPAAKPAARPMGGADRSEKALPAAGTVDSSSERSAPDADLNLNQFPGDRSGPAPDDNVIHSEVPRHGPPLR